MGVSFFVTDHAGTPMRLVNENGRVIWQAEPDDWGAVRNEKTFFQGDIRQPIRFQGQWLDEETGFYYNRHRFYDPRHGRYITQDPIGLAGGMNAYRYPVNPVFFADPLGLETCVLTTRGKILGIGGHSALYMSRGFTDPGGRNSQLKGGPVIYDPGGTYHTHIANVLNKGSAQGGGIKHDMIAYQFVAGKAANIQRFKDFHKKENLTMVCRDTTEQEEREFFEKALDYGHTDGGDCAGAVSSVIKDSETFPGVTESYTWPGSLERAAKKVADK